MCPLPGLVPSQYTGKAELPPGSQFGTAQKGTDQHKPSPSGSILAAWWEVHFNEFFHEGIQEVALNCTCSETEDSHKLTFVVIWPSNYIQINTSKKQLWQSNWNTEWDWTGPVPHQAHTAPLSHTVWIKPSQKCIFPVINPQKQKAELAGLHPNISQWGWSWALSCPWGLWKQKAIADGWVDGRSMGSSEHWHILCTAQSHPCRDRQQDIITGSQIPAIPLILPHPRILLLQHKNQTSKEHLESYIW